MSDFLIDTCAALWMLADAGFRKESEEEYTRVLSSGGKAWVSPISAWEVGMLISKGRLNLSVAPGEWFRRLSSLPGHYKLEITETTLIASHFLPGTPPNDPMDRIIIATAREHGLRLVTRDRLILSYANAGHVQAMAC
jgi:PIN domain nuclease of toxin-antitoxin system